MMILGIPGAGLASEAGRDGLAVLNLDLGARPLGMGGAFVGLADDINALAYNPAGLGSLKNLQATFLHRRWLADTSYSYVAVASPLGKKGAIALGGLNLGGDPIEAFDSQGNPAGSITSSNRVLFAGYGLRLMDKFNGGFVIKYVEENLDTEKIAVLSGDVGLLYDITSIISAGLSVSNVGSKFKYLNESSSQPTVIRVGFAASPGDDFVGLLDIVKQMDDDAIISLGAEYTVADIASIRAGYGIEMGGNVVEGLSGLTLGVGFKQTSVALDYAFVPYGNLGQTHVISFTLTARPLKMGTTKRRVSSSSSSGSSGSRSTTKKSSSTKRSSSSKKTSSSKKSSKK